MKYEVLVTLFLVQFLITVNKYFLQNAVFFPFVQVLVIICLKLSHAKTQVYTTELFLCPLLLVSNCLAFRASNVFYLFYIYFYIKFVCPHLLRPLFYPYVLSFYVFMFVFPRFYILFPLPSAHNTTLSAIANSARFLQRLRYLPFLILYSPANGLIISSYLLLHNVLYYYFFIYPWLVIHTLLFFILFHVTLLWYIPKYISQI